MPGKSNNLGQFWQELKRRRVIHVITVYATSAFVIIELVNNLAELLNLPARMPIIVVVVLAIGFPLAIILSWLYDLTSEGVERTKPLSEIQEGEKPAVPNAWKIATYVSFAVIIGLVVLNVMGRGNQIRPGDIQSLVILPFANYTGDDQLEWFVSGMHASLIMDMQRISGFDVINRTSSNAFKNVDMQVHEIALELNADAAIEADVMCLGDSICLRVKVISAFPEEKTLWSADYKEEKSQILNLYHLITKQIANEVNVKLTPQEESLLAETKTVDKEAYDAYLKGYQYWDDFSKESLNKALEYLNIAIEKDPEWAPLYAGLAIVWRGLAQFGFASPDIAGPKIDENINKALELDPDLPDLHFAIYLDATWDYNWEKGEKELLKALAINPNNAMWRIYYAHLLMVLQRSDEALAQGQLAVDLDPLNPLILSLYAVVLRDAGNYQSAIQHIEKALSIDPNHWFALRHLADVSEDIGDYQRWFELWKKRPEWQSLDLLTIEKVFHEQGYLAAIEEIIQQCEEAAKEMHIPVPGQARRYLIVKKYDKAMDWLEMGYKNHHPGMSYISTNLSPTDQLKDNPRYIELLKKMNLPLPED